MEYKYSEQMSQLDSCPPSAASLRDVVAYRLVRTIPATQGDFLPPAILTPSREFSDSTRCFSYALSFFNTEAKAKKHLAKLKKRNPQIEKTLGSKVLKVEIEKAHGKTTQKNQHGHFALFERAGVVLEPQQAPESAIA